MITKEQARNGATSRSLSDAHDRLHLPASRRRRLMSIPLLIITVANSFHNTRAHAEAADDDEGDATHYEPPFLSGRHR